VEDINAELAKGAIEGLKDIAKELLKGGAAFGKDKLAKLSVDFEFGFKEYLDRNLKRLSQVKTLLNPNSPVSLEATYVAPNLELENENIEEGEFIPRLRTDKFFVITGLGGSGKSIFLKHLFIRHYNEALGRIPTFIELRQVKPDAI
jgi:hypothetical protein